DLADCLVAPIADIDVSGAVDGHSLWVSEPRRAAAAVGAPIQTSHSGERRHYSRRRDLADGVVVGIGDVDVAAAVNRHPSGVIEPGRTAGAVDAVETSDRTRQVREGE